ncbi:S8 family peptidase [Lunatibacter salilacus]|uniref:S8 family peptidase n=1 Tax=Lunatibacter salilacus TaxID=2483804 RepID=UPI00131C2A0E|nr:S8 family peptidase [Lunatibacter salilacus]
MNSKLPHLYLRNPSGYANKFDKSRNITNTNSIDKDPEAYRRHKQRIHASFNQLLKDKAERLQQKALILEHIEIIEIKFFVPFSDGATFKTRTIFLDDFGLSPVMQKDFNRTVLFAIVDEEKLKKFNNLLNKYIQSDDHTSPRKTSYAIMTILYDVKFHTATDIRNQCSGDMVFELINNNEHIHGVYDKQLNILKKHLDNLVIEGDINFFNMDPYEKMIQIKGLNKDLSAELASNFDILAQAHALRSVTIKPDQFNNAKLTWDLTIKNNNKKNTVVGILDNGIRPIDPVKEIIRGGYDITSTNDALSAAHRHGTVVASLASVGERYFTEDKELVADAHIYSIKILENFDGYIDVIKVVEAIRNVHLAQGIRLFNLSVCAQSKLYNESPSLFAYLLDKLAYEEDLLIFIAAGNMHYDDLVAMQDEPHELHNYPNQFYNPGAESEMHSCIYTNICTPAESMNNITVGALAENYRNDTQPDLSLDKNLPAYYSRKNHYDFKQRINGGILSHNHGNRNLFKPDIVMPGGDVLQIDSGMQVLGFGELGNDYYIFDSGTSLATPLALNLAVQLLNLYPNISLQSIKALMINSADPYSPSYLEDMVMRRKQSLSSDKYGRPFEMLDKPQKTDISRQVLSAKDIHRNLVGYGRPDLEKMLYSTPHEVSLLVEDTINTDHHKVLLVHVPKYLLDCIGSKCLDIRATLCFKTNPAWGNHVDYNPLHISFNFANCVVKDLDELAAILADRDHDFYRDKWTDEIWSLQDKKDRGSISEEENNKLAKLKLDKKNELLGVKTSLNCWSEDFFPLVNKPLSNRQQMTIRLDKRDIEKIDNQLVVVMRCAVKENLDADLQNWVANTSTHSFSLAIRIHDISKLKEERSLYDELKAVNSIEVIQNNIVDLDQDLHAEV